MSVRAIRGAVQVERDDPVLLRDGVQLLIKEVMSANSLDPEALISMVFTATPDLVSAFPAAGARELGLVDLPLMCARELDVKGALPRTVRLLAHVETDRGKSQIRHVYLGGAAELRPDLARPDPILTEHGRADAG
ncbi:chorismate mutase [Streptomyces coeruleorubidus]|uniref:chorismate mutase n=1 Tax=Streptomyces coeruleorubidus TaxID=116188 RepID=UPI0036A9DAF8